MKTSSICAAVLLLTLAAPASAVEIAGFKVPQEATVEGSPLVLNGAGLRTKFFVKVYVGALYLPEKSSNAETIISADKPKRIVMTFVRDLEKQKLADSISDGFKLNSTKEQLEALQERLDQLAAALSDVKKGEQFVISYSPGKGTHVKSGSKELTIEGKDFADALFAVWFGKKPADSSLKSKMLGQ